MKWKKVSLMTILSMGVLWMVGCGEESPLSPGAEEEMSAPAAKLTRSTNRVAGTCELPHCRSGFGASAVSDPTGNPWQVADVVGGDTKPFAIGHRGFGINLGEDSERPIENTVEAVRDGFLSEVSMVEVDVQLTQDGHAVVFHDDILVDATCINTLPLDELQRVAPEVPTLKQVLQTARPFTSRQDGPSGIVDIEIKAPSPRCDPNDVFDSMLVAAVVSDVEQMDMTEQVLIESFSPAVVAMAAASAPDMARVLSVSVSQFLTAEQVEAATGLEVNLIDKDAGFGLQWANTGGLFRLPGYDGSTTRLRGAVLGVI